MDFGLPIVKRNGTMANCLFMVGRMVCEAVSLHDMRLPFGYDRMRTINP